MLPHLNAAYNLAKWLVRDARDAEDVVQTAYLRAFEAFGGYVSGNSAGWILTIVRNTAYTWLDKQKRTNNLVSFNEVMHSHQNEAPNPLRMTVLLDPETLAVQAADRAVLLDAIDRLPVEFREVLLLREVEGCSYKEIAEITRVPTGTIMSRLSRARRQLQEYFMKQVKRGNTGGL